MGLSMGQDGASTKGWMDPELLWGEEKSGIWERRVLRVWMEGREMDIVLMLVRG